MFSVPVFRRFGALLIAWIACAVSAHAQSPWCGVHMPKADHPLSWANLQAPVEDRLDAENYEAAYQFIIDAYAVHYGDQNSQLLENLRQKLDTYLKRRELEGERPSDWRGDLKIRSNNYYLTWDNEASGSSNATHNVPCESDEWAGTESPEVAVFYVAVAMQKATGEGHEQLMKLAANEADAIRRSHHDWHMNGFAMWPWELKLNELRVDEQFNSSAPSWQWVLLRPTPALAIRSDNLESTEMDMALMLEPLGFVSYLEGSRYKEWWGLSAVATVTDDNGAGYGLLARYNEFLLGAAHHEAVDEVLVYFSVDLYQYLLSNEERVRRARDLLDRY